MKYNFKTLLILFFALPFYCTSQESIDYEPIYEVKRVYPPLSIAKEKLSVAQSLADLNEYYKPAWISEFISVEVLAFHNGQKKSAVSENDTLSQAQKMLMKLADVGENIEVRVRYIPDNTLLHNDVKDFDFTFSIEPEQEASFPGGSQQLKQYIELNAIDKIPDGVFRQYQLAAVKFTIDEKGEIIDPHIFWTSDDEETDKLLLESVCNMPTWKPAEYANGLRVKQDFALMIGDMESCVVNLLNIRLENDE